MTLSWAQRGGGCGFCTSYLGWDLSGILTSQSIFRSRVVSTPTSFLIIAFGPRVTPRGSSSGDFVPLATGHQVLG